MHLTSLFTFSLAVLTDLAMSTAALSDDARSVDNMVPRQFTAPDGTAATVYVNRDLEFNRKLKVSSPLRLSKRVTFTAGTLAVADYCGETNPSESFGADAPLASDCTAIKQYMDTISGYYTVARSDFSASTGWATIVSHGTCSFAIKFQVAADTKQVIIGTNDVYFYVQGYVGDAQGGRIKAIGTTQCINNAVPLYLYWGMVHS